VVGVAESKRKLMKFTGIIINRGTPKYYLVWGIAYIVYVLGTIGALLALMDLLEV
jgi:hypothetical protein